ncbi:chloramphenicol acetyltransferase 3 [Methanobrevibacter oralis]|uniref:Chloramphenicol acetyltransferase 3 n=1 Tax=Methanobrevibacter oralis TaxID=66851 RepID=A0A166BE00_METOA|nr:CatA-like O-acetyltransferase [Methanobrevibacter oralis]KZX13209.1 chloramphenicol acetyltransferase 3 [Methanobrevibacter oralis]
MKEIEFNLDENPFINFQSSRYTMSAKINVEKLWKYSKNNNKSFFILSLGCLINAVNSVPQLKRRIHNNKVIEYDYLDGVSPIMDKNTNVYREMRVDAPYEDILEWHDYVKNLSKEILSGKKEGFALDLEKRDETNIANFSCIPWVDFESMTSCIASGNQIQPLITWGKVNESYDITVSICVSHIFVNGYELGLFYKNAQDNFSHLP